ncbi:transposase [Streptomyces sp. NPDC006692]|uniref:transposase n=1 Tax=unclassified Streptomyces TaxID=2593676 RepID=UPI003692433E
MIDAVRYLVTGGITWRAVSCDFPGWDRVYAFAKRWRVKGLLAELHDRLRGLVREDTGRDSEPTAAIIDSQSVKADATVPAASRGFHGGKKINGRKWHVLDMVPRLSLKAVVAVQSIREVRDAVASPPEEARRGTASGRHHAEAPEELPPSDEGLECKPE